MGDPTLCQPPRSVAAEYVETGLLGRNRALLIGARDAQGDPVRAVVKIAARLERPPVEYLLEWLGSAIARRLGIDTPEPLAVTIDRSFAASVLDKPLAADLQRSCGIAFGSTFAGPGLTQWKSDDDVPVELRDQAVDLLVFDVFTHNFDRRRDNPNLLTNRGRFVAIDHELAFAFLDLLVLSDPVLDPLPQLRDQHVLGRSFGPRKTFSLDRISAAITGLDDSFFGEVRAATPAAWTVGGALDTLERVISVLCRRRDAVGRWLPMVDAWMRK